MSLAHLQVGNMEIMTVDTSHSDMQQAAAIWVISPEVVCCASDKDPKRHNTVKSIAAQIVPPRHAELGGECRLYRECS